MNDKCTTPEQPRKTIDQYVQEFREAAQVILERLADEIEKSDKRNGVHHDYSMLRRGGKYEGR